MFFFPVMRYKSQSASFTSETRIIFSNFLKINFNVTYTTYNQYRMPVIEKIAIISAKLHIVLVKHLPKFDTLSIHTFYLILESFWPLRLFLKLLNRISEKAVGAAIEEEKSNHILHICAMLFSAFHDSLWRWWDFQNWDS